MFARVQPRATAWRRSTRALGALGAVGAVGYVVDETNSHVLSRSLRVVSTFALVAADYRLHVKPLDRDSDDYKPALREFNARTATRVLNVCFQNGGIYTKYGQQLATFNHAFPREITDVLATLQDRAKPVSFAEAMQTVENELQRPWQEVFAEFDESPIASASLAQVHHAVDKQGRHVAVKVQYPHLEKQMRTDLKVIRWTYVATEYLFPALQMSWMLPEFEAALHAELDFDNEKQNSRRITTLMARNAGVYVPKVYDSMSSKKLLVMEFIDAPKISDVTAIRALGLEPQEVSHQLCEVFGEMVFCHGFVHCDPHAGNIFVRRHPESGKGKGKAKPQLVLLDHGLYRELDEQFRRTHCDLWRAMLLRDSVLLQDCGRRMNAGEFASYLPLLFTYRSMKSAAPLASSMNEAEKLQMRQDLRKLQFSDVSDFLQQLPRDMFFVFRTNNMIRSLNKDLGGTTRDRFSVMGKYAVEGHAIFHGADASRTGHLLPRLNYWWDHANLIFHLTIVDWALRAVQFVHGDPVKPFETG